MSVLYHVETNCICSNPRDLLGNIPLMAKVGRRLFPSMDAPQVNNCDSYEVSCTCRNNGSLGL